MMPRISPGPKITQNPLERIKYYGQVLYYQVLDSQGVYYQALYYQVLDNIALKSSTK